MKKEYIVKLVFTGIFIFMLWWVFLIWQRFVSPQLAGLSTDKATVLMFWYDTQGKRSIPEDARLDDFSMSINKDGIIEDVKLTVLGEKNGEMKEFTYTEDRETKKRSFKEEKTDKSSDGLIKAQTFFSRFQKIYLPKFVEGQAVIESKGKLEEITDGRDSYVIDGDEVKPVEGASPTNHVPLLIEGTKNSVFYIPMKK